MPHDVLVKALYRVHAGHRFLPQPVTEALYSRVHGSQSHVSVILMRLNVNNRTQAVVEGLKRGLVYP
jgi:DNA-binding NarL/FixJ family response regulator